MRKCEIEKLKTMAISAELQVSRETECDIKMVEATRRREESQTERTNARREAARCYKDIWSKCSWLLSRQEAKIREKQIMIMEDMEDTELKHFKAPVEPKFSIPEEIAQDKRSFPELEDIDTWYYIKDENREFSYQHCLKELRFHKFYQKALTAKIEWCVKMTEYQEDLCNAFTRFKDNYEALLAECRGLGCPA